MKGRLCVIMSYLGGVMTHHHTCYKHTPLTQEHF